MTKEEIEKLVLMNLPFLTRNKKGKLVYPFISRLAMNHVIEGLIEGIDNELNKKDE